METGTWMVVGGLFVENFSAGWRFSILQCSAFLNWIILMLARLWWFMFWFTITNCYLYAFIFKLNVLVIQIWMNFAWISSLFSYKFITLNKFFAFPLPNQMHFWLFHFISLQLIIMLCFPVKLTILWFKDSYPKTNWNLRLKHLRGLSN